MERKEELIIPTNVRAEFYIFDGFGIPELLKTVGVTLCIAIAAFLIYLVNENLTMLVFLILTGLAAAIGIFTKDRTNRSMVDYIAEMAAFQAAQKHYLYDNKIEEKIHEYICQAETRR